MTGLWSVIAPQSDQADAGRRAETRGTDSLLPHTRAPASAARQALGVTIADVISGRDGRATTAVEGDVGGPASRALLERSDELAALRGELAAVRSTGAGRLVLIAGEAGIGKTALVHAFCSEIGSVRVLSGACEALLTPRPLGPLADIAEQTGGELAVTLERGPSVGELLAALSREVRRRAPTVVVLEDLHWADQATLDLVRLLGRRIEAAPALVLATFRDDELGRAHPLRIVLGELPRTARRRLTLSPLSPAAVDALAAQLGMLAGDLHARTAGNPFYVTETLAAGGTSMPAGVRDAVLARAARLDDGARAVLDAVSISPLRIEHWLLEALAGDDLFNLEQCLAAGMLHRERDGVAFRHEIARAAIEEALPLDRFVALHRLALRALTTPPHAREDLARVAHHAEAAGDRDAVLRYAAGAGERAAVLGAHREAAAQFARALRYAERLGNEQRARLLERRSYECYLTNAIGDAIEARREALALYEQQGDRLREGDARRWLSRLLWYAGENPDGHAEARRAVELLEGLPPGPELAMAYSNMSQMAMVAFDMDRARSWGERAHVLAEQLGDTEIVIHALNNLGSAELGGGSLSGTDKLELSLAMALAAGLDEHVARAYSNLAAGMIELRQYALGDRYVELGLEYCRERDLDSTLMIITGWQARSALEQGRLEQAAESASIVLDRPGVAAPARITPLLVLGVLRARRGDPDPWGPLEQATALAYRTGEVQWLAPVAVARAEARWLEGENEVVAAETGEALALATAHGLPWAVGELRAWRWRAGIAGDTAAAAGAEPFRLELNGRAEAAAHMWRELGCPYEAALALASSDDEDALRRSLSALQGLGAGRAAARLARTLRERGIRDVPHGPRASTRENVAGLTARELEVLALLDTGMRNGEIAERLVLSRRTVEHHVSAILRKLSARTRTQAVVEAARLGMLTRPR
jgi:DNA-binding CsgD family transcriptional regulator